MLTPLLLFLLVCLLGSAEATRYTFSPWSFELPGDEEAIQESRENGLMAYKVNGVSYLFTPPEALGGRTLEQMAQATIGDLLGSTPKTVQSREVPLEGGGNRIIIYAVNSTAGQGVTTQYFQFAQSSGQWGLHLVTLPVGASDRLFGEAVNVMAGVNFRPAALGDITSPGSVSRLPDVPWPAAHADRVALSTAKLTYPQARKMGLDPGLVPLPDTFDCYLQTHPDFPLRAMNPTPEAHVTMTHQQGARRGTYTLNDGVSSQKGTWQLGPQEKNELTFDGPLDDRVFVRSSGRNGQSFEVTWVTKGKLLCFQQGPAADTFRLELLRGRLGSESFQCLPKDGKPYTLKVDMNTSTYTTPGGKGYVRAGFTLERGTPSPKVFFSGGPFHNASGFLSEDFLGNRLLDVKYEVVTSTMLTRQTRTYGVARCTSQTTPKPDPLYGQVRAAPGSQKGGPSGLFIGNRYTSYMSGTLPLYRYVPQLTYFTPDGYVMHNLDPGELGGLPDCTRTHPNGEALCQRYEVKGNTIRFQNDDGSWDDPIPYGRSGNTVTLDKETLYPLPPFNGPLSGLYAVDGSSHANTGGPLSGVFTSFDTAYQFSGKQFSWRSTSSSSFSVGSYGFNPDSIIAGGGSTRTDSGEGTFTLKDSWLTLKFTDGRVKKLFVYTLPPALLKDENSPKADLNIDASWLQKVQQK